MLKKQDIIWKVKSVVTKVDDIQALYRSYDSNEILRGILDQSDSFLDVMESGYDLFIYGYHKWIHEANDLLDKEGIEVNEGRIRMINYVHMVIEENELYEGFPTDEEISEMSQLLTWDDINEGNRLCNQL